jgi:hypothetical protein
MNLGLALSTTPSLHHPTAPTPRRPAGPLAAISTVMNNAGHLPISETARRVGKSKARRGRPRKDHAGENAVPQTAAVGTLTRTKSLLLAALRVWELKHRISD